MTRCRCSAQLCFLFVVLFATSACATLGGRNQPVAINTEPRGVAVAINSPAAAEDPQTPLALNVSRGSALELEFHHDAYSKKMRVDCQVRLGTVFGGNLPLGLLGLPGTVPALLLYASAVGLDFLTGSAFECPHQIEHTLAVPESLEDGISEKCSRILIHAPALEPDLALKAAMVSEAQSFGKRFDDDCVEFVPPSVSADALKRSMLENIGIEELLKPAMERKRVQLLRDTGAVKAIEMQLQEQNESVVTVSFGMWDLYSKEFVSSYRKNFKREKFETLKGGWVSQFLGQSLKLLPNSIALSASNPSLTLADNIPTRSERITGRPSLVALLSVTSVEHPNQYGTWDAGFQFGPSIYIDSLAQRASVDREQIGVGEWEALSDAQRQPRNFKAYALTVPFDAVLSFHTPAGAFRLFLGYGPLLYFPSSETSENLNVRFLGANHAGLDWVAYFSDNVFFQFGAHAIARSKTAVERQGVFRLMGWQAASVGVGYYFPATSGYVESLLSKNDK
jgi:hypothetical protein